MPSKSPIVMSVRCPTTKKSSMLRAFLSTKNSSGGMEVIAMSPLVFCLLILTSCIIVCSSISASTMVVSEFFVCSKTVTSSGSIRYLNSSSVKFLNSCISLVVLSSYMTLAMPHFLTIASWKTSFSNL